MITKNDKIRPYSTISWSLIGVTVRQKSASSDEPQLLHCICQVLRRRRYKGN